MARWSTQQVPARQLARWAGFKLGPHFWWSASRLQEILTFGTFAVFVVFCQLLGWPPFVFFEFVLGRITTIQNLVVLHPFWQEAQSAPASMPMAIMQLIWENCSNTITLFSVLFKYRRQKYLLEYHTFCVRSMCPVRIPMNNRLVFEQ